MTGKSPWRSISEAPKDGTEVLVYGDGVTKIAAWVETLGWFDGEYRHSDITHFMPLPEPPEGA